MPEKFDSRKSLNEILSDCDQEIRSGRLALVAAKLQKLSHSRIPREFRLPLAKICRRIGQAALGTKLLSPLVFPDLGKIRVRATPEEIAEYAALISRLGSIKEALKLLEGLNSAAVPEVLLHRAACHVQGWRHDLAIPLMKRYLASQPESYAASVMRVNLSAALISMEQFAEAGQIIEINIAQAREKQQLRLLANCLEQRAQIHFFEGRLSQVGKDLEESRKTLGNPQGLELMLINKWQSIVDASVTGKTGRLETFRAEAIGKRYWDHVREADYYLLKASFEQRMFDKLVFGSPYERYRARVLEAFRPAIPSATFLLGGKSKITLDLESGEVRGAPALKAGRKIHQLFEVLSRDLYRPPRIGAVFAELYPDEHFDVFSSPKRVHAIVGLAREWIREGSVPASIEIMNGEFRLVRKSGFSLMMPLNRKGISPEDALLTQLKTDPRVRDGFSMKEACESLGCSRVSFHRLAARALQIGRLKRSGKGKATRYYFAGESVSERAEAA